MILHNENKHDSVTAVNYPFGIFRSCKLSASIFEYKVILRRIFLSSMVTCLTLTGFSNVSTYISNKGNALKEQNGSCSTFRRFARIISLVDILTLDIKLSIKIESDSFTVTRKLLLENLKSKN